MAHLNLGLLAYWIVNTVRFQLKRNDNVQKFENKKIIDPVPFQWNEIVRIMNTQKAVTTLAQNKTDEIITVRRCSFPSDNAKMIYDKLGYKYVLFKNKKSVVHKTVFQKNHLTKFVDINSS
jgi:hypothetical protein